MKTEDTRRRERPPGRTATRIKVLIGSAVLALAAGTAPASAAADSWYLSEFGMSTVWQTTTGAGVVVADVDTGVNAADADLAGRLKPEIGLQGGAEKSAVGDSSPTYDGTETAVLLAGTGAGGSKIQGLAPKASVLPIQIQDSSANGIASSAGAAIHYAVEHGAKVILFPKPLPDTSASFEAAVKYAVQHDAIVIAGAGNNGSDAVIGDPCAAPGALCVSATTQSRSVATLSSVGPDVTLAAPGAQIPVPRKTGAVGTDSSTHFSAALTAGEAALVWSAHPQWTAGQVIRAMLNTTTEGNAQHTRVSDGLGYGIINPAAAVAASTPPQITNPLLPVAPTVGASASATAKTTASAPASSGGSSPWLWVGVGAAVLIVAGAAAWLLMRNRPRRHHNYLTDSAYLAPTHQVEAQTSWPLHQQAWPQQPQQQQQPQQPLQQSPVPWPNGQAPQQSPLPWPTEQQPQQSPLPWPPTEQAQPPYPQPWPPAPPTPPPGGGETPHQD